MSSTKRPSLSISCIASRRVRKLKVGTYLAEQVRPSRRRPTRFCPASAARRGRTGAHAWRSRPCGPAGRWDRAGGRSCGSSGGVPGPAAVPGPDDYETDARRGDNLDQAWPPARAVPREPGLKVRRVAVVGGPPASALPELSGGWSYLAAAGEPPQKLISLAPPRHLICWRSAVSNRGACETT
jgi:hypothetical protein